MKLKTCSKCKIEKPLSEFYKDNHTKDKLTCRCKICQKRKCKATIEREELFKIGKKKCTKCGEIKELSEFHKENSNKDGYRSDCKLCRRQYVIENMIARKKYRKDYCDKNKEKLSEYNKNYYLKNIEQVIKKKQTMVS